LLAVARQAVEAVGAPLAGVDLLPALDGNLYVLEVNAVPGWRAMSQTSGRDIAKLILDFLESK
jgi:ribosomal protein S6--L-glutamate ligase